MTVESLRVRQIIRCNICARSQRAQDRRNIKDMEYAYVNKWTPTD